MTSRILSITLAAAGLVALGACSTTEPRAPAGPALRTGSAADEAACERAVATQTQNGDTVVLSSEFSQANTEVVIGVGPNRAKWRCLVSGGKVGEIMSLTDEGAL